MHRQPRGLTQVGRGHQHTPDLSLCSWVQIGIEKSRSQLKLEIQRIWRDKIPIISCPPPLPVPSTPSATTAAATTPKGVQRVGRWANEVTGGGAESAYKNSIPLSIEVNKTRQLNVDGHLYNAARISVIYLIKVRLPSLPPPHPLPSPPPPWPLSHRTTTTTLCARFSATLSRHKACASEVSMRQSLGMTMLIPRMNASDAS